MFHSQSFFFNKGSHTSASIKKQFDEIIDKFEITNRVFKIVADQAANVKCAFKNITSVDTRTQLKNNDQDIDQLEFVEKLTFTMLFKQRKTELLSQKENILAQQLLKVI